MSRPLAVDLCCGLGGWTDGLLMEGWDVVGFDVERHRYGDHAYPAQLVLQDIRTLHGGQFRGKVQLLVASPPCTEFSWMSMPWSRAKQVARALRGQGEFPAGYCGSRTVEDLTALVDACFRIAREAECPIVLENVRGAQPWIGRARYMWGSFGLWGDVLALMPITFGRRVMKEGVAHRANGETNFHGSASRATKNTGGSWFAIGSPGQKETGRNPVNGLKVPSAEGRRTDVGNGVRFTSRDCGIEGGKNGGDWFGSGADCSLQRRQSSKGSARKAASALIAKIPLPLARFIGYTWHPSRRAPAEAG